MKLCLNALIVHICKSFEQFVKKNLICLEYNFRLKYFLSFWSWGQSLIPEMINKINQISSFVDQTHVCVLRNSIFCWDIFIFCLHMCNLTTVSAFQMWVDFLFLMLELSFKKKMLMFYQILNKIISCYLICFLWQWITL